MPTQHYLKRVAIEGAPLRGARAAIKTPQRALESHESQHASRDPRRRMTGCVQAWARVMMIPNRGALLACG